MVSEEDRRRAGLARDARRWVQETVESEVKLLTDRLFCNTFDPDKALEAHAFWRALRRIETRLLCDMEADRERAD